MKQILLMIAVVALVGCGKKEDGNTGVVKPNLPLPEAAPEKLIADPIIEKAVREELNKPTGELTKADLEKVTVLSHAENQLTELPKGLEKLDQLTSLFLGRNQLTDVKGLEKLTELKTLFLTSNKLTNLKGLEKLTQLKVLYLTNNKLTDVKGLENLTQLKELHLSGNQLTDVPKGLEKLTQLEFLNLNGNKLASLSSLEKLYLEQNPALTKAQIDELQKALPKCQIKSNPTK